MPPFQNLNLHCETLLPHFVAGLVTRLTSCLEPPSALAAELRSLKDITFDDQSVN